MEILAQIPAGNGAAPPVACIGAGAWGKNLVRAFHRLGALAAVCDSDEERRGEIAAAYPGIRVYASMAEALADRGVAAVAIATPAETHGRLVREALAAGRDVFVEKPLCLSVAEGRELAELARDRGRVLMVGHLLWYHPAVLRLKELTDEGRLGRILYIYSARLNLGRIRREENILWSFAPHDISVILGLVGEMPDEIAAQGGNYLHERIADVTVTLLSFPSGVKAHLFVSWLHPFKEQKLVVVGDRQMAVFDDLEDPKLKLYPHAIEWRKQTPIASRAEARPVAVENSEPLVLECRHFLECVHERRTPRTSGEEALRVLEVLERCQEALGRKAGLGQARGRYFAHPSAFIDEGAEIGEGTTIWHVSHVLRGSKIGRACRIGQNVVIGPNVTIGNNVKIQNNVSVYEGVTLEDEVFCGPAAVFTNVRNPRAAYPRMHELRPTLVRRGATLGANCTVVCGVTIGEHAFVGAGAVVVRDVPDFALVVGNPARVVGWMCACGERVEVHGDRGACRACARAYAKTGEGMRPL